MGRRRGRGGRTGVIYKDVLDLSNVSNTPCRLDFLVEKMIWNLVEVCVSASKMCRGYRRRAALIGLTAEVARTTMSVWGTSLHESRLARKYLPC